ncbi:MAG: phosphoribosylanthranilate isomerase [Prevotella sp.]|nr:phosphoribosylanthranilate isomerase [Prevotella sp.]
MIIKVCGMREAANIREIEALGINWLGLIFWPKSSRYVSERPDYLPTQCKRVGVFVDEDTETIQQVADDYALDIIQLHGHESPEQISHLSHHTIIKAFSIATDSDLEQTKGYEGLVDYFLFDTKGPSVGGNGTQFDWDVLNAYHGHTPFLLSGGIGPEDAARIRAFHHPQCIGIDLNSRFEKSPGRKDVHRLKTFLEQLNNNKVYE